MKTLELWIVSYLANALWMIPLVFAAAWAAGTIAHKLGPKMVHRIWVAALFTEVLLPALHLRLLHDGRVLWLLKILGSTARPTAGHATVTFRAGAARLQGGLLLPPGVVIAVVILYAGILAYFAARLVWSLWMTRAIVNTSAMVRAEVEDCWQEVSAVCGVSARIAESAEISGPVTVGILNGLLLLPQGFADRTAKEDLNAVFAHECAHMARHDFARNVLYSAISLPCAFHPFLWLTRARLSESREMICDAMAAEMLAGPRNYARSLLRLASMMADRAPAKIHAIGIFDANHLERRVMQLTKKSASTGRVLRIAMFAACGAIGLATWASALTLRTDIGAKGPDAVSSGNYQETAPDRPMPVLIHAEEVKYPAVQKKERLNGVCLIGLTVDEEGVPRDVHVVKSLRAEYDLSAIKAVERYRFKPAMNNGRAIAKNLNVEVQFVYH